MRIHVGADHAAFEAKRAISDALRQQGYVVIDHGPTSFDPGDDYPRFVIPTAAAVVADRGSLGIVLGGSGNGEAIAANKVKGVRAALIHNRETAQLAREHNDANVASIGARQHDADYCVRLALWFLEAAFTADERHRRRLELIDHYESTGSLD